MFCSGDTSDVTFVVGHICLACGAVVALCISTERAFILWQVLALQHITESYNFDPLHPRPTMPSKCSQYIEALCLQGAQWLIGSVLDSRPRGRGSEPHRRHCVVVLICFVCFVALRPKSTAMVIAGRSVHLTTLFPGQA